MKILDQYGKPIDTGALKEPQTSRIATLENQYLSPALNGLTPSRLSSILRGADSGDLVSQHRLFADMEERDAHLLCEMGKRKLAVMDLDWNIVPPRNATAAEKANAEWLKEVLTDAVDPFEDLLLALMEGVGHGFAPVELEWRQEGKLRLPSFWPRPQEWFRLDSRRRELRLIDASADGAALVANKLITFPPAIARALTRDMNKLVAAGPAASDFAAQVLADRSLTTPLWLGFAERPQAIADAVGVDVTGYPVLLPAETPRHVELHHRHDGNDQRPATPADYDQVLAVLNDYDTIHGGAQADGHPRLVASKQMDNGERFKATFEVRPGKRNRSLALVTLVVKR